MKRQAWSWAGPSSTRYRYLVKSGEMSTGTSYTCTMSYLANTSCAYKIISMHSNVSLYCAYYLTLASTLSWEAL